LFTFRESLTRFWQDMFFLTVIQQATLYYIM
jgi:hypothetical protein